MDKIIKKIVIILIGLIVFATSCKKECNCHVNGEYYYGSTIINDRDECYTLAQKLHMISDSSICSWE
jgi:hypothetical protein